MEDLKYPVGRFDPAAPVSAVGRAALIDSIADMPRRLRAALQGMTDEQLDTPYRDGGWTVRQLAHHVPDSHMNAYIRFRWALTEPAPTIKTYDEKAWAELPDAKRAPIGMSLDLLDALHIRWVTLLRALKDDDFVRGITHPEMGRMSLGTLLNMYEWHGRHHVAHVTNLCTRIGWH